MKATMLYRIRLIGPTGRTAGHLRYHETELEWPTGHEVLGDTFDETEAHNQHAGWEAYLAARRTGYTVQIVPAGDRPRITLEGRIGGWQ